MLYIYMLYINIYIYIYIYINIHTYIYIYKYIITHLRSDDAKQVVGRVLDLDEDCARLWIWIPTKRHPPKKKKGVFASE